jgi:hypothetical protein
LDGGLAAVAVVAAASRLGVEGFEGLSVDLTYLEAAKRRSDVLAYVALVHTLGVGADIEEADVPLE